jgi:hypothetical protein
MQAVHDRELLIDAPPCPPAKLHREGSKEGVPFLGKRKASIALSFQNGVAIDLYTAYSSISLKFRFKAQKTLVKQLVNEARCDQVGDYRGLNGRLIVTNRAERCD